MKQLFKKLAVTLGVSLMLLHSSVQATWSFSKPTEIPLSKGKAGKPAVHVVQIFSSINATKAEGMKNTLEREGYPAFVQVKAKQKRPHYQVQIGPFDSKSLAYNAKNSIIQLFPQYPFLNEAILKVSMNP